MQHIHILGICGTFMGSLAQLAKALGYRVTGSDTNVYPPMSTQLEQAGIELFEGWGLEQLDPAPDVIVVGNVIGRGNPVIEAVLERMLPYTSGPQWLAEHVLQSRWVLAVAGTHGKTTTSSMLAHILEHAGMAPGFLIGGVPKNFDVSARLGDTSFFVIEADEYDSAFFDKRSKFVHYRPHTLVMNNLEYDHADIFPDLAAIERQFHHLVRTVPGNGLVIYPEREPALQRVVEQGCWTPIQTLGGSGEWQIDQASADGSQFDVLLNGRNVGTVRWALTGDHNQQNALAAIAAARHVGVEPYIACEALGDFESVKRRMEKLATIGDVTLYDDFAHHPTAIATTLAGLRAKVGAERIIAVIEPRSNTMKQGALKSRLVESCQPADAVFWYQSPSLDWSINEITAQADAHHVISDIDHLVKAVVEHTSHSSFEAQKKHIVVMSNGGFQGIHQKLEAALSG